jgi:amidase
VDLWQLDATDLAHLIRTGRASAREAVTSVLSRVDAVNPKLNAIVRRLDEEALAAADAADAARARGEALGPLHGVPVTTKVNVDQKGLPNDNGVPAYRDVIAQYDAPVVANLRSAGAIILGRTNTPSFSMRAFANNALHGHTLNPRDPEISPGGSSGGAGACAISGMGPIAHGNDIAGSVRIPAYCCGTVGLRVSLGRVPAFNLSAASPRPIGGQLMSVQGPLTRTIRDCRLALAAMARGDDRDTRWVPAPLVGAPPLRPIRVALVPEVPGGFTHPAQSEAVRTAGRHLAAAGYAVDEILPPDSEAIIACWHAIGANDVFRGLGSAIEEHGDADTIAS